MVVALQEESKITAKGQTTVPVAIRRALGVDCGGSIAYRFDGDSVTLHRAESDEDPVVTAFLSFLAADMASNPGSLKRIPSSLKTRIGRLTAGMDIDPDAEIEGAVAI